MKKIIILGAGVIGVTSAYFLRKRGFSVTVIERDVKAGQGTSYGNGAQLSYSKTFPFSNPSTLRKLPQYLFGANSPVHFYPVYDLAFFRWCAEFVGQSTSAKANANNEKVVKLALESRDALREVLGETTFQFDLEQNGKLYTYSSMEDYEKAKAFIAAQNDYGFNWQQLSVEEAIAKEPALNGRRDELVGVSYCPIDESGDCEKFTRELAAVCAAEGVEFIYETSVDDFVAQNGRITAVVAGSQRYEADEFVIAAGVGSAALAKKLGEYLPVYPMKGYSITAPIKNNAPKISITDEARRIVYSTIGDRLRVAGIAEFSGFNMNIRPWIMLNLIEDASSSMPDAADWTNVEQWTGLRPMTPSTVPIIGRSKRVANLSYNVGQGMLGWTLACGSANRLAGVI